jgi:hypothetical protein
VFDAVKQLWEKNIGDLEVMKGEEVAGIVTERDYAQRIVLSSRILEGDAGARDHDVGRDVHASHPDERGMHGADDRESTTALIPNSELSARPTRESLSAATDQPSVGRPYTTVDLVRLSSDHPRPPTMVVRNWPGTFGFDNTGYIGKRRHVSRRFARRLGCHALSRRLNEPRSMSQEFVFRASA